MVVAAGEAIAMLKDAQPDTNIVLCAKYNAIPRIEEDKKTPMW